MKKIVKYLTILSLSLVILLASKMDFYAASASLTGPSSVRVGDTITLNLNVSDSGKFGLEGSLSYDSSVVSLAEMSCNVSGWKVENNGNAIIVYDDALANPLGDSANVLTLTFRVNEGVADGTAVNISINGIVTTDGSAESNIGTASYSTTVAAVAVAPLSSNANLSSLSVSEGTISPGFSADTTSYSIGEVDYSVTKLNVSYKTEDEKAAVSINGNDLSVGSNTVSVVVSAENGAIKTYNISVVRKPDSSYAASSDASLSNIVVSSGMISPEFSSDVEGYIVYLPYEYVGKDFAVSGSAADSKAQGVTDGLISPLAEGVNTTSVSCKAEDGTTKSYKITVVVMPQYNGAIPNIEGVDAPIPPVVEDAETESTEFEPSIENNINDINQNKGDTSNPGSPIAIVVIILLSCALVYVLFFLNRRNRM